MRTLGFFVASLLLAACPGPQADDDVTPDGPDDNDAPPGVGGLSIQVATDRSIPAEFDNLRIDDIRIGTMSIRAIGDAASSGDPRTTKESFELHWDNDDAPALIVFDKAPSGRYSTIKIDIAKIPSGEHGAIEIDGRVRVDGDFEPFEIESDDADFSAIVGCLEVLSPGETVTLQIDLEVDKILDGVDLAGIAPDGEGVRKLDDDDQAEIAKIVAALTGAFKLGSVGDN